jgi:transcriptional regulator with XRE-family HTH domain
MSIGTRIRDLRWDRRLKQGELARRAGIAQNTLSRIELGETTPSVPTLEKIARGLSIDLSDLLQESGGAGTGSAPVQPERGKALLENHHVREWLQEHGARFGLMGDEEFVDYVRSNLGPKDLEIDEAGVPQRLLEVAHDLKTEGDKIDDVLFSPNRRKSLDRLLGEIYAEDLAGLGAVERAIETGRMASELRTRLRSSYLARETSLINYSVYLQAAGLTKGRLVHGRKAAIEAARERALEGVFSNARGA